MKESPPSNPYPPGSRHHGLAVRQATLPNGRTVSFLDRRLVTDPDALVERTRLELRGDERLDHVAAAQHGSPTAWWLLVEAHVVDHPEELVAAPGRRLRIVLPPTATAQTEAGT